MHIIAKPSSRSNVLHCSQSSIAHDRGKYANDAMADGLLEDTTGLGFEARQCHLIFQRTLISTSCSTTLM